MVQREQYSYYNQSIEIVIYIHFNKVVLKIFFQYPALLQSEGWEFATMSR